MISPEIRCWGRLIWRRPESAASRDVTVVSSRPRGVVAARVLRPDVGARGMRAVRDAPVVRDRGLHRCAAGDSRRGETAAVEVVSGAGLR